jgi:hypothetical protein
MCSGCQSVVGGFTFPIVQEEYGDAVFGPHLAKLDN